MEKETMETATKPAPAPASAEGGAAKFLQLATGFMPARALQCAVMLGLFDKLEQGGGITASEIAKNCGLVTDDPNNRSNADFLDLLVALGCLQRDGNGPTSTYSNTPEGESGVIRHHAPCHHQCCFS